MKFGYRLLMLAVLFTSPIAAANFTGGYPLPNSKAYLETCQRQVLQAHPGVIVGLQLLHQKPVGFLRYALQAKDGTQWFMVCDLANGNIVRAQQWVDGL